MFRYIYSYVAIGLALIAARIRSWQVGYAIDQNQFYLPQYQTLCTLLGYGALAVVLVMLLVARLGLKPKTPVEIPKKNQLLGGSAWLVTLTLILQGTMDYTGATNSTLGLIAFLCCFGTALCFGLVGACQLVGKKAPFWTTTLPVITHLGYLVLHYANFNGIAHISENMITTLFICSFLGLIMSVCRIHTGINLQKGIAFAYGTAAATALFGLCASLPHWLQGHLQFPIGFGGAVYAIFLLWQLPSFALQEAKHA